MEKHDKRLREKTNAVLRKIEQVIRDEQQPDTESTLSTEEFASRAERMEKKNPTKQQCRVV